MITADTLHCQREHARWLHARSGHYLFTVKGISRRCAGRRPRSIVEFQRWFPR